MKNLGTIMLAGLGIAFLLHSGSVAQPCEEQDQILEALFRQAFCRRGQDGVCFLTVEGKAPLPSLLKRLGDLPVRALPTPPPDSELVFNLGKAQRVSADVAKVYAEVRGVNGPLFLGCTYTLRRRGATWLIQEKLTECVIT